MLNAASSSRGLRTRVKKARAARKVPWMRALLALMVMRRDELRVRDPKLAAFLIVRAIEAMVHSAVLDRTDLLANPGLVDEMVDLVVRYLEG
jgi:hypothetical protein